MDEIMRVRENKNEIWDKLIQKAQKGNQTAITELYNRTYSQGFSVALQMVKNEEDAMDILQNAYISAFNNLHTIREPEKFRNWFNCVVANKCRDFLRKHKEVMFSELEVEEDVSYEETLESDLIEFSPEQSVDYSETKKLVNDILQALPQEQRLCILMYYYNELSIKEIAETLECSENTVKSRLNYARKKIKEDVKALEKKGTKLYNIAPIPFIVWMLRGSESAGSGFFSKTIICQVSSAMRRKFVKNLLVKLVTKKVVAGIVTVTVVSGATVGAISLKQDKEEHSQEEVKSKVETNEKMEIDYEFLKNLFCYLPEFNEEDAITNEEFFSMMCTSMLYYYVNSNGNSGFPTFLNSDVYMGKVEESAEEVRWEYAVRFKGDAFDEVAEIICFEETIDSEFLLDMDPEQFHMKWEDNSIKFSVEGLGGFVTGYDVEITDVVLKNKTWMVEYILSEIDYIENVTKISNRTAVLEMTDSGYRIVSVFEREGSTGARSIVEPYE